MPCQPLEMTLTNVVIVRFAAHVGIIVIIGILGGIKLFLTPVRARVLKEPGSGTLTSMKVYSLSTNTSQEAPSIIAPAVLPNRSLFE